MNQYEINGKTILAVKVPEDANDFQIMQTAGYPELTYPNKNTHQGLVISGVPPGNWSILGRGRELKRDQIMLLADYHSTDGFGRIYKNHNNGMYVFGNPESSFRSWLKANNIPDDYLLLIKLN